MAIDPVPLIHCLIGVVVKPSHQFEEFNATWWI
jgi:hypothetical protein